jgi:hypothetical protein
MPPSLCSAAVDTPHKNPFGKFFVLLLLEQDIREMPKIDRIKAAITNEYLFI